MDAHGFTPIADGCFRDTTRLIRNATGEWCWFEFTPILNPKSKKMPSEGRDLVAKCTLAGGGWQPTSPSEEVGLRNYKKYGPASDIPGDPKSGYVITREDDVSPPSGCVWAVSLHHGGVYSIGPYHGGFVRGGRLVPASQADLAFGPAQ